MVGILSVIMQNTDELRKKCQLLYPSVAKVFGDLSEQYLGMAKEMDNQATIAKLDY